jgi:hypothetical protein
VFGEPCKPLLFFRVGSEITYDKTLGSIAPQLFQMRLHVFHEIPLFRRSERTTRAEAPGSNSDDP